MNIEPFETVEHIYDTNLVKEALYYIEQGFFKRGKVSKEVISRISNTAMQVLTTLKKQPITIDTVVNETEDVAREYFGDDFIAQFDEIRKKIAEQNATLFIHGTDIEIANMAMQTGLEARSQSITSTAIRQTGYEEKKEYDQFSTLLNWPHRDYKGLVLIAIPNECLSIQEETKPIWEYRPTPDGEVKTSFTREYVIKPEYIVGVIDVVNKQIIENPVYTNEHSYDGLVLDDSVFSVNMLKGTEHNIIDIINDNIEDNPQFYGTRTDESSDMSLESEAEGMVEDIYRFYNWILATEEKGMQIVESKEHQLPRFSSYLDGTQKSKEVSEVIDRLTQIAPSLKTMEIDDKEIDDFISDVKMSDINKINGKIKRYQEKIEQQEVNWEEPKISDEVELDDDW